MRRPFFVCLVIPLFLLSACSKDEESRSQPAPNTDGGKVIVNVGFGSGADQVQHILNEEGSAEGPNSFDVDANGKVYVLDQVNRRIVLFQDGRVASTIALPDGHFDDLELDGSGFALLDRFQRKSVVYADQSGSVSGEVPLQGSGVPEVGRVTGLFVRTDGSWVEVDGAYLVHIAGADKTADTTRAILGGQLQPDGKAVLRTEIDQKTIGVFRQASRGGPASLLARVNLDARVAERTMIGTDASGRVALAAVVDKQTDPEQPQLSQVAIFMDENGVESRRVNFAASEGPEDTFRSVKLGDDGNVYALRTKTNGIEIVKVTR